MNQQFHHLCKQVRLALRMSEEGPELDFFLSALCEDNPEVSVENALQWLEELRQESFFSVEEIPLKELRKWCLHDKTGDLVHESGRFFAIRGLEVFTNVGTVAYWSQPIIDQTEIGLLGFVTQKKNGVLHFLVQAKPEPGNINGFQISPTVQATKSNFDGVHGGLKIPFFEFFISESPAKVLVDQLLTEQGARFYRKRNRNMIVQIPDDIRVESHRYFRWLTLAQINELLKLDNTVNMDSRSVLSTITFDSAQKSSLAPIDFDQLQSALSGDSRFRKGLSKWGSSLLLSAHANSSAHLTLDEILRRLSHQKFLTELRSKIIPLNEVQNWRQIEGKIFHETGQYFEIIGLRIKNNNREIPDWDQPIVRQTSSGIVGFLTKEIEGVMHFLVQMKMECGNLDLLELAPTVQCITGSYKVGERPPFVDDVLGNVPSTKLLAQSFQSEEGGRFFHESNRNVVAIFSDKEPINLPPTFLWMNLSQLKWLLKCNNFLNIEARSLLSGLQFR